jgi:hypothetical protein
MPVSPPSPRPYATLIASALVAAALFQGCTAHLAPESIGSVGDAIEGGHLINDDSDPVSKRIPLSTVGILNRVTKGGVTTDYRCTGVILSTWKVLTAAHCVGGEVRAYFYPVGTGAGASRQGSFIMLANPVKPAGIDCHERAGVSTPPADCFLANGTYADIAVLNFVTQLPAPTATSPWKPAWLAPRGSFATSVKPTFARWAVGAGRMNSVTLGCADGGGVPDADLNPSNLMEWVAVSNLSLSRSSVISMSPSVADRGDSGGPIYQYAGNGQNLAVTATAAWLSGSCASVWDNWYVDVTQPDNYDWIVHQGATETPATASFGAGP